MRYKKNECFIFLPMLFCKHKDSVRFAETQACCVAISPHGDQLLLMNKPRPYGLWNVSQVLGQWPPTALFWSCWFWFYFWLGKSHLQTTTKSLPRRFDTDERECMHLFDRVIKSLTLWYLESDFHIGLEGITINMY